MGMVRVRHTVGTLPIPDGVHATVKGRVIRVYGPRGKLTRKFNQSIDITRGTIGADQRALNLEIWFGRKKDLSSVKTLSSHINNMFIGVTKGINIEDVGRSCALIGQACLV